MEHEFKGAIEAAGYSIGGERIIADDKIHRLRINGERNASFSYRLKIEDGRAVG